MDQREKTFRWAWAWGSLATVLILAGLLSYWSYTAYLNNLSEAKRYAIIQQRGGEPVCIAPDGIYVKYPAVTSTAESPDIPSA